MSFAPQEEEMSAFVEELKRAARSQQAFHGESSVQAIKSVEAQTDQIAHVIGMRGEHLAQLNAESGASITVIHGTQRGRGKVPLSRLDVQGEQHAVNRAAEGLRARLEAVRSPRRVSCERALIGKVIGRNGERVKEIQEISGASVQVDQRFDPCVVEISGPPAKLLKAEDLVRASIEGRYASSLNRIADAHTSEPVLDPYKDDDSARVGGWHPARDPLGRVYWYHALTGKTQWENPYQYSP